MSRYAKGLAMPSLNSITPTPMMSLALTDATGCGAPISRITVRVAIAKVEGESL